MNSETHPPSPSKSVAVAATAVLAFWIGTGRAEMWLAPIEFPPVLFARLAVQTGAAFSIHRVFGGVVPLLGQQGSKAVALATTGAIACAIVASQAGIGADVYPDISILSAVAFSATATAPREILVRWALLGALLRDGQRSNTFIAIATILVIDLLAHSTKPVFELVAIAFASPL